MIFLSALEMCFKFFSSAWNTTMHLNRIIILDNAGSGKSSLARKLSETLSSPVIHLDRLFWEPNWSKPVADEFRNKVSEAISGPRWICEGNYHRRTFDLRLPKADLIIWLDTPRITCLKRVIFRTLRNAQRTDLPDGCSEKMNRDFLLFLKIRMAVRSKRATSNRGRASIERSKCSCHSSGHHHCN